jgi:hypothetical protein
MSIKGQPQRQTPPEIIIPPSARRDPDFDFDEERVPIHQQLGDISDKVFNFVFSPNTIKFGILLFCAFCIAINITGYYDLLNQVLGTRLDAYGRTLPVDAPMGERFISSMVRFPFFGTLLVWLDRLTGGIVALFGAITLWFVIQGLEISGRFDLYFEGTAENLLYRQNRKRYESPANHPVARKAYRLATRSTLTVLRYLTLGGLGAYILDIYAMNQSRPWLDNVGNPLWINVAWNGLAVVGVEMAMLLYRGFKAVTLSNAEKVDKDRHYGG